VAAERERLAELPTTETSVVVGGDGGGGGGGAALVALEAEAAALEASWEQELLAMAAQAAQAGRASIDELQADARGARMHLVHPAVQTSHGRSESSVVARLERWAVGQPG
jgi:phage/plasmid primase-like uncharacterized protein